MNALRARVITRATQEGESNKTEYFVTIGSRTATGKLVLCVLERVFRQWPPGTVLEFVTLAQLSPIESAEAPPLVSVKARHFDEFADTTMTAQTVTLAAATSETRFTVAVDEYIAFTPGTVLAVRAVKA